MAVPTHVKVYSRQSQPRSPWLAVNLSAVFPGLGQFYGKAWIKSIAFICVFSGLMGASLWSIFAPKGDTVIGLGLLIPILGLYLISLWDSYRTIRADQTASSPSLPTQQDPWYPVFLSQILPGFGQLYLQKALWGGALLIGGIILAFFANYHPAILPFSVMLWVGSCFQAYQMAPRHQRQWGILSFLLLAMTLVRLTVASLPTVVNQALDQVIVPSKSMVPTLLVNDRMFVHQSDASRPQVREIVVFVAPPAVFGDASDASEALANDLWMVKRVIGLPGEEVTVRQGQVWIDGTPLGEPYLAEPPNYTWGPATVPPDQLFVLGDNRNESSDSHIWGFLPMENLVGRAYKIYWPPARIQPLP